MHIGLPKEIKDGEYRVALTPEAAVALVRAGVTDLKEINRVTFVA